MDEVLFQNRFLALIQREDYTFCHEVRTEGKTVSLLPFRDTPDGREFLARIEICPAHDLHQPGEYSITGGVKPGESVVACAQRELLEESGYHAAESDFIDLGTVHPSKMMDTTVYLFAIDVAHKQQDEIKGDGSRWETGSSVRWVDAQNGLRNLDPLFMSGMIRLQGRV
jgi:8-oxo-dGTP pyrophosphatase MutT (NUDIX family)